MPDASISNNSFHFANVKYQIPSVQNLVVENIGQVAVKFHFIPKLDEKYSSKPFITINPKVGLLLPGEKVTIAITVLVNNTSAADLNSGKDKLEDILILHLENGKDYFITITGEYQKSCFGSPLEDLVASSKPIRNPQQTQNAKLRLHIPKELWRIVDYIFINGLDEENLFLESGDDEEMANIRECLDTGSDFSSISFSIHSMAETLIRLLESLAEPVIPYKFYQQCLDHCNSFALCQQILRLLPPLNYNVFVYLMTLLRDVLKHTERNKLTSASLAVVFSSVILRAKSIPAGKYAESVAKKKTQFILNILSL